MEDKLEGIYSVNLTVTTWAESYEDAENTVQTVLGTFCPNIVINDVKFVKEYK